MKKQLSFIVAGILVPAVGYGINYDYCAKNPDHSVVMMYADIQDIDNKKSQKEYLLTSKDLIETKLDSGDRFLVFRRDTNSSSAQQVISTCYPGCKPQSFKQMIFGAECQQIIVKRDLNTFNNTVMKQVYSPARIMTDSASEIIEDLLSLVDENLTSRKQDIHLHVFSNSFSKIGNSRETVDDYFVKIALAGKIPDLSKRKFTATLIGLQDQSEEIKRFWVDLMSAMGASTVSLHM